MNHHKQSMTSAPARAARALGAAVASAAIALSGCGGGGASTGTSAQAGSGSGTDVAAYGVSSGAISAFGSVFVNGHEFETHGARIVDDDTGATSTDMTTLEVGMSVDVKKSATSTDAHPSADEIRLRPLVRGVVDASDTAAGSLLVLGQSVQVTAATNFSDHRACVTASASPCTAVAGQSDLSAATGSGSSAVAGSYVTVYGYLYSTSASSGRADVVATLVVVDDVPAASSARAAAAYKVEGVVSAVGTGSVTIGGLLVDLSSANCRSGDAKADCASAFSVGQVVSALGSKAPSLPATTLVADSARQRAKIAVESTGASIEVEGKVSSVTSTAPAALVVRGIAIDASSLTGTLPAVGDDVRIEGTVGSGGTSIVATSITVLHAAASASLGLEGDVEKVEAGTTDGTTVVTLLGQPVTVDATTRLADRTSRGAGGGDHPFNATTIQAYLAASTSKHVLVRSQADASGQLKAVSLTIVPASTAAAIGGLVDATPPPVNSSATGTPTTFALHGVKVSADPASIVMRRRAGHGGGDDRTGSDAGGSGSSSSSSNGSSNSGSSGSSGSASSLSGAAVATIAAGDLVLARGTYADGTLTVAAPSADARGLDRLANIVIDSGAPTGRDHDLF